MSMAEGGMRVDSSKPLARNEALALFNLFEETAYRNGVYTYEIRLKTHGGRWLAVVKAHRKGELLVAFVGGDDLYGLLLNLGEQSRTGNLSWGPDKHPPPWALIQFKLAI